MSLLKNDRKIYLCSTSPRRKEMVDGLRLAPVIVQKADFEEVRKSGETPSEYVLRNAVGKLESSKQSMECVGSRICAIAADTIVTIDGVVFEKPKDRADARQMLMAFSGRSHDVLTGVALLFTETPSGNQVQENFLCKTSVAFMRLTEPLLEKYLDSNEWIDKAGGYGIQGFAGQFVLSINGSYSNVVGLPMADLLQKMILHGFYG